MLINYGPVALCRYRAFLTIDYENESYEKIVNSEQIWLSVYKTLLPCALRSLQKGNSTQSTKNRHMVKHLIYNLDALSVPDMDIIYYSK